jgi:hypothetical protein
VKRKLRGFEIPRQRLLDLLRCAVDESTNEDLRAKFSDPESVAWFYHDTHHDSLVVVLEGDEAYTSFNAFSMIETFQFLTEI